jgi:hypothetical protein
MLSGDAPGTDFCYRLSLAQGHSAAGSIKSMKNSSDPIDNQRHGLPACSAVTQPTAPPFATPLPPPHSKRLKSQM